MMQRTFSFTLAVMLAANAGALETFNLSKSENGMSDWSCATCTVAFKGIDTLIESSTFQKPVLKIAQFIC